MLNLIRRLFGRSGKPKGSHVHFTGHRILADAKRSRFPAARESEIDKLVRAIVKREKVGVGYGGLASGADILIAEALLEAGAELHVVLPCKVEPYIAASVAEAGEDWVARFHEATSAAASLTVSQLDPAVIDFGAASDVAMEATAAAAEANHAPLFQLALFDGEGAGGEGAGGEGAGADIERAKALGWRQVILLLRRRGKIREV